MVMITGIGGGRENNVHSIMGRGDRDGNNSSRAPSSGLHEKDDMYDDECSECGGTGSTAGLKNAGMKRRRRKLMSCATLCFLLAIDALTIGFLFLLFAHMRRIPGTNMVDVFMYFK